MMQTAHTLSTSSSFLAPLRASVRAFSAAGHPMAWLNTSLLHHVQQVHPLFPKDSKHFVDMPVRTSVTAVLQQWQVLESQQPTREQLHAFVSEHFGEPGSDMEVVRPQGWEDDGPAFLQEVSPPSVQQLGRKVHNLWRLLHRKVTDDTKGQPDCHTLLPLPSPAVVPGDRFREVYYWDSYWIIVGLLASELHSTAVGMVRNLLSLVDAYGHVPNGSRTYYTNRRCKSIRPELNDLPPPTCPHPALWSMSFVDSHLLDSQPPLLSAMVAACHAAVLKAEGPQAANQLLQEALPRLLRTWDYWTCCNKAVRVSQASAAAPGAGAGPGHEGEVAPSSSHVLSRYYAEWEEPRPESYREDVALASHLPLPDAKQLFREVASAAESGWDFSSRWLADGLSTIRTTQVVPVDLNALLYLTACHISQFAAQLGDSATADAFRRHAEARKAALNDLMWDEHSGCWHDLLITQASAPPEGTKEGPDQQSSSDKGTGKDSSAGPPETSGVDFTKAEWTAVRLPKCYASNWVPLWCGCCEAGSSQATAAVKGLQASGLIAEGGVLTSRYETGQQWDAPNAWAPLQHMMVQGLRDSGTAEGQALARQVAHAWVNNNLLAFERTGHMHEKYDAWHPGAAGGGGEYEPQVGFGWTNGVLLEFLRLYPQQDS